jgi:biotin operon repressor
VSNHLTSLAYKLEAGSLLRKSVLILLADKASDDGSGIWASKQTMADELCCSKQAVWKTLQEFMSEGLLTETGRKQHQNGYTITYALKLAALEAMPRVKRWADNQSTVLTSQPDRPVNDDDETSQPRLPKPPLTTPTEAKASYKVVIDHWNAKSKASGIPAVRVLNHSRQQMLNGRIKEHGLEVMLEAVDRVHASPFCRGEQGDGRKADIMFILQPKTLPRVLEGFYGADEQKVELGPAERIAQLRRLIPTYEERGEPHLADRAKRIIAELETANPMAAQLANLPRVGSRAA